MGLLASIGCHRPRINVHLIKWPCACVRERRWATACDDRNECEPGFASSGLSRELPYCPFFSFERRLEERRTLYFLSYSCIFSSGCVALRKKLTGVPFECRAWNDERTFVPALVLAKSIAGPQSGSQMRRTTMGSPYFVFGARICGQFCTQVQLVTEVVSSGCFLILPSQGLGLSAPG